MEKWPRRAKLKPEGWVLLSIETSMFLEWLSLPGLEQELKDAKARYGLPREGTIITFSGEEYFGKQDMWLHPIAAYFFRDWQTKRLGRQTPPDFGFVYAAIYDNGLTKVGMSLDTPENRLASHDSVMNLTGSLPIEHICMECKTKALKVERRLISMMCEQYQQKKKEWFIDTEPDVVRQLMTEAIEEDLLDWCQSANINV